MIPEKLMRKPCAVSEKRRRPEHLVLSGLSAGRGLIGRAAR